MSDFAATKALFHLPKDVIYLDGNSLGPLPIAAAHRMRAALTDEWGELLITGWNKGGRNGEGWMAMPTELGNRIARLVGAEPESIVLGDTLSIKVYQALASALEMRPERKVVLSDSGNFPSDLYMADGLIRSLKAGHELRVVAPEDVLEKINEDVAAIMITEVDYRTGRRHDMKALTKKAHACGALAIWDLAHSAGALPVQLADQGADFAVGCTYKYLNGGPGAPAFIYVAPRHLEHARPALSGWLGHDAPFAFDMDYRPAGGIERMRVGTPPILALGVLETAMDIWDMVEIDDVREKSIALCDRFITGVEATCPDLTLASPRDAAHRGSQVSFNFPEGYAAMQALIARGVIGDFRAPDIMRFGFTPLYIDEADVDAAVAIIADVMSNKLWDNAEYRKKSRVT